MTKTRINVRRAPTKEGAKWTVYVGNHPQSGRIQRAFAEKIGHKVGACVREKLKGKSGLTIRQVWKAVEECAPSKGSIKLF